MSKSSAEGVQEYREKKLFEATTGMRKEKRPPKTSAERARDYRARKKALKDAMSKFDLALSVDSDFGLSPGTCASYIRRVDSYTNETKNNEHASGYQNFNANDTHPTIPITSLPEEIQSQYELNIEMKQSPSGSSPVSTPPQTQHQCDDSQSVSLQNYTSAEEDHEIFGAFIASELRGLGNNYSLIRSVKKKIQLTILAAYETFEANHKQTSTPEDVTLQQPQPQPPPSHPEEPKIKIEIDDDNQHAI